MNENNTNRNFEIVSVNRGKWEIDQELGKIIVLIKPRISAPTDLDILELVDMKCGAEYTNDNYAFTNPKVSIHRPPQLNNWLTALQAIIDKWKAKRDIPEFERKKIPLGEFMA